MRNSEREFSKVILCTRSKEKEMGDFIEQINGEQKQVVGKSQLIK
jgi:hypothetical protein